MYDADIKKSFLSEIKLFLYIIWFLFFGLKVSVDRYLATIDYTQVDICLEN